MVKSSAKTKVQATIIIPKSLWRQIAFIPLQRYMVQSGLPGGHMRVNVFLGEKYMEIVLDS